jgi:hypothetical protein
MPAYDTTRTPINTIDKTTYPAVAGYDQATGLGSLDATNLFIA